MTDDTARVLAALKTALGTEVSVTVAWPEQKAALPAAVLLPARRIPACEAGGEILLTEITQTVCLTARSFAALNRMADQAEQAMRGLGYSLCEMSAENTPPRRMTMAFRSVTDGESFFIQQGVRI